MLRIKLDHSKLKILICLLFFVNMICLPAFAQTAAPAPAYPTAETMLVSFSKNLPNLMRFVTALAYVLGMLFILRGIAQLKHMGESRTMMSREHSAWPPIIMISVGAMLLYLPSSVQVGMSTFWNEPNPYAYMQQTDQWSEFLNVCYMIIQFIGTIAFIRGLIMLSKAEGHHGGGVSKAFAHIIGGILCINIYQFVQVILVTFGLNQALS